MNMNVFKITSSLPIHKVVNKVPEITIFFWIIKVLCTTVGETVADFLNTKLNLGLTGTTIVMGSLLAIALFLQLKAKKYIPGVYWFTVVLISVSGTLITDNLTDNFNVPLSATTIIFALSLAAIFVLWYLVEKSVSVHKITTFRREIFYWLVILSTFALGTATGDLIAETFKLGYLISAILFSMMIAAVTLSHFKFKLNSIITFWLAYILTRPLGASLGDLLSQPHNVGGLELGTIITSIIFLTAIVVTVVFVSVKKKQSD